MVGFYALWVLCHEMLDGYATTDDVTFRVFHWAVNHSNTRGQMKRVCIYSSCFPSDFKFCSMSIQLCSPPRIWHLLWLSKMSAEKKALNRRDHRQIVRQRKQHIWRYKFNIRTRHTNIFSQHLAHCTDQMIGFYKCFCFNRKKKTGVMSAFGAGESLRILSVFIVTSISREIHVPMKSSGCAIIFFLQNMKST